MEGEQPKVDPAKAGVAPVETKSGEQEVDFKTLTAEEAFQVLGVRMLAWKGSACCPDLFESHLGTARTFPAAGTAGLRRTQCFTS